MRGLPRQGNGPAGKQPQLIHAMVIGSTGEWSLDLTFAIHEFPVTG